MISCDMDAVTLMIQDHLGPFWVEIAIVISFTLGFLLLRGPEPAKGQASRSKSRKGGKSPVEPEFCPQAQQAIEAESTAGNGAAVLSAWRRTKAAALTPIATLRLVVKALIEEELDALQAEVIEHLCAHPASFSPNHAMAALDSAARFLRDAEALEQFWGALCSALRLTATPLSCSLLLGGYAAAGDERRVAATFAEMAAQRVRVSDRGYSLVLKGFLKNGLLDAVRTQLTQMVAVGVEVPAFAPIQYCRLANEANSAEAAFDFLTGLGLELPPEAVTFLLDDCVKRLDMKFAGTIDEFIRAKGMAYSHESQEVLLKLYASAGDLRALKLFAAMRTAEPGMSEAFCVALLSRCAEPKFIRFAEEIMRFSRARGTMSIAAYSALMKVYALSGKYEQACDLYEVIVAEGLEPDAIMYGCLMKFAVECGRTDLSWALSSKTTLEIQNYMSLIRAAGRDKDAGKALAVLQQLKSSKTNIDIAAYNCALDAVASAGDIKRAEELMEEIRALSGLDIISYNTLLKGYCSKGDVAQAKKLLQQMEADGHAPNDVSYNSFINVAVSKNMLRDAWATIDLMESKGVPVDCYTISIMMKSLKRSKSSSDFHALLTLLDRSGLGVTADEVLLNSMLDACIRFREFTRLEGILAQCFNGELRPAVHTYGALIKACGALKWVDKGRELWKEMTEHRAMEPNAIVVGCMLDFLVTNQRTEEAVKVFRRWKKIVPPNAIMFSTLMKGFAASRQSEQAMELWREMRSDCVAMNTVVYNAVIDSQARVGAMDRVAEITETMKADNCQADAITSSTIVKGFCIQGDLEAALKVFRGMQKDGQVNDSVVYNTLLDGCAKLNRFDVADQLLEEMERARVAPSNFTLGILMKLWGRQKRLGKAFEAMREIPRRWGISPNAQVYAGLMGACLANGAVRRAHEVFEELRRLHGVDAKAYSSLIAGCTRHGELELAVSLVEEACGPGLSNGERLGPEPVEHLLRALVSKGRRRTAVVLLQKVRAAKVKISGHNVTHVLGG